MDLDNSTYFCLYYGTRVWSIDVIYSCLYYGTWIRISKTQLTCAYYLTTKYPTGFDLGTFTYLTLHPQAGRDIIMYLFTDSLFPILLYPVLFYYFYGVGGFSSISGHGMCTATDFSSPSSSSCALHYHGIFKARSLGGLAWFRSLYTFCSFFLLQKSFSFFCLC